MHRIGIEGRMYFLTTGVRAAWTGTGPANLEELSNAKSVTLNLEKGEADVTTRNNNGWKATVGTLKDASVEFEMVWDTEDAGFTALQQAYFQDKNIAIAVLDGDKTADGTQGLWADWQVLSFSREEPAEEAMSVKVTIKPAYTAVAPEWVTIANP